METCFVALDNSGVLTVKLGRETSFVAYSTDKRSTLKWPQKRSRTKHRFIDLDLDGMFTTRFSRYTQNSREQK